MRVGMVVQKKAAARRSEWGWQCRAAARGCASAWLSMRGDGGACRCIVEYSDLLIDLLIVVLLHFMCNCFFIKLKN